MGCVPSLCGRDKDHWRVPQNTIMDLEVAWKVENFFRLLSGGTHLREGGRVTLVYVRTGLYSGSLHAPFYCFLAGKE